MRTHFERSLRDLRMLLVEAAGRVENAVRASLEALLNRDSGLSVRVLREHGRIHELEERIHEDCLRMLALKQPKAGDLRLIASALRISSELKGIGNLARSIAGRAMDINDHPPLSYRVDVESLGFVTLRMLEDSVTALVNKDAQLARDVCGMDDTADLLTSELIQELLNHMVQSAHTAPRAVQWILVARSLERMADLVTNICEATVLYIEGTTIKHHCANRPAHRRHRIGVSVDAGGGPLGLSTLSA